jgi:osmotically-inducible protein OsmY
MAIVAISRGAFSGAEALAQRVAGLLGYRCLSREQNLDATRKTYTVSPDEFAAVMEKRPSFWERVLGERAAYLTIVRATLCEQAVHDNLVYHGYLGHRLLPGVSHVIGVRVISDRESCVQAAMQQLQLSREQAAAHVETLDRERQEWTRFLFGVDWNDSRLYDVVVNLTRLGLEGAGELVAGLARREAFRATAESLQAMQDLALRSRVEAALAMDFRTRDAGLSVTVEDGIVTVSGTTSWPEVERAIPAVVRRVEGVKDVRSRIVVPAGSRPARSIEGVYSGPHASGDVR